MPGSKPAWPWVLATVIALAMFVLPFLAFFVVLWSAPQ